MDEYEYQESKLADIINEIKKLCEQHDLLKGDIYTIDLYGTPRVHLPAEVFDRIFQVYETVGRDCDFYPFERFVIVSGVQYFAIFRGV